MHYHKFQNNGLFVKITHIKSLWIKKLSYGKGTLNDKLHSIRLIMEVKYLKNHTWASWNGLKDENYSTYQLKSDWTSFKCLEMIIM